MRSPKVEIICQHCGATALMHAYRIKNGTGKYCSQSCYLEARWGGAGNCRQCGAGSSTQFCTPECQKTWWNRNSKAKHPYNWRKKLELISSLGGKCECCGFSDVRALDIDHIDPSTKMRPKGGHYTWSRRLKDWKENDGNLRILCANCHRLHTWQQRGFGDGIALPGVDE